MEIHLKKITEFYSLTPRETILLELFNLMDETEQIDKLCNLAGYLGGHGILSLEESKNYRFSFPINESASCPPPFSRKSVQIAIFTYRIEVLT